MGAYIQKLLKKLNEQPNKILKTIFKSIDNYALKSVSKVVVNSDELKNYLINKEKLFPKIKFIQ